MNKLLIASLALLTLLVLLVVKLSISKFKLIKTNKIPQVIHKIFINENMEILNISPPIKKAMNTWTKLNPGYTLKIWNGNECRNYLSKYFENEYLECFDNLIPYAYKTDFMRYCILYNEGGWYSDWQQILLSPLNTFDNYSWVSCWDTTGEENKINGCMQNGFIGSCKNNIVLKECLSKIIKNNKFKDYGKSPWYPTGPCLLGDMFRKFNNLSDFKLGNTQNDEKDGPCFVFDNKKLIINKCCLYINKPSTVFENGNSYLELWKNKNIYVK